MMAIRIQYLFYFVAIAAFLHNGIALQIEIAPETFNEVVTDELTVTCTLNGSVSNVKQIIMLEIWRKKQSPLAIIRSDEITRGPGLKFNMKAMGYIDKNISNSYLKLTIKNPVIDDAGTYRCLLFYLNELFQLKEARVDSRASVTVDQTDIAAVVTYLMGKVSGLEKTTLEQGDVISKQKDTIMGQDSTLKKQEKQLKNQQDLLKKQMEKDRDHEAAVNFLEDRLAEQKMKLKQQNDSMIENRRKTDDQERQLMEQQNYMMEQSANATYVSAFSYEYIYKSALAVGTNISFSDPIMNIGDDYNPETGIFTAPRDGLYSFHLVVMTYTSNSYIHVDLKVRGSTVASLYAYDSSHQDQSTVSSVASLKAGDKVWPVVTSLRSNRLYSTRFYSVFTGYLLRLL